LEELKHTLLVRAAAILPKGDDLALDRRQHELLTEAATALGQAAVIGDPVLVAEELRLARQAIDRISGSAGVEDLLDTLFGRFCLGK
ncbi:MAG: tRNA uridine-5-carboxymethylaminomethyl(34) synthesis GTPase MnmE, partial [Sphingomicrobium sp.]